MDEKDKLIQELRKENHRLDYFEEFVDWLKREAFGSAQFEILIRAYEESRRKEMN